MFAISQCQGTLVKRLDTSRAAHPAVRAIYIERITAFSQPEASEGKVGWGGTDSEIKVECGFDANSSYIRYLVEDSESTLKAGGSRTYFNVEDKAYQFIENDRRGTFGSHAHGMINPLAFGYEVYGEPASKYFAGKDVSESGSSVYCKTQFSQETLGITRFENGQTAIQTLYGKTDLGYVNNMEVSSWKLVGRVYIPEIVTMEITKEGRRFQSRQWKLISVKPNLKGEAINLELNEGASLKDNDSNTVYIVQGGKLVLDPVFSKEASNAVTLRRLLFFVFVLVIVAWACNRVLIRRSSRSLEHI